MLHAQLCWIERGRDMGPGRFVRVACSCWHACMSLHDCSEMLMETRLRPRGTNGSVSFIATCIRLSCGVRTVITLGDASRSSEHCSIFGSSRLLLFNGGLIQLLLFHASCMDDKGATTLFLRVLLSFLGCTKITAEEVSSRTMILSHSARLLLSSPQLIQRVLNALT